MIRGPLDKEGPDRLYTVTGGRSRADESRFDMVTLIVSESDPTPGMQSEHVRILRMCRRPLSVVEISSYLELPVSVVKILLCDLLDTGRITARHPQVARPGGRLPGPETLKKVLVALQNL
ncbi:DUF742 domain-containing protein [Streptomyces samsunensis]|uniref:Uncharacterized protein n=3 Tax=Streptomyces TaxID=1883 RepID=A0A291STT3_STRMQ|nr:MULTISPECIES: DUF742 domain-containing protein [Streptomyces]MYU11926.1 DUF742 domain-containing protein [Streptomyces sp. SID8361]AQA12984.1 hypothetical protein BV401_23595 [Streptomyces autolyticus]ATL84231.1 hypothetical protein SMALA_3998 [Streptomyces malaysiensis]AUA12497.1 hypothetical protein CFP59_04639 [Streptomyces sp. M56]MBO3673652.1 DUF742 domain-containing protein [Streptomyces sp. NEAU-YJ-81]